MKKNYLSSALGRKQEWVDTVSESFDSAYKFYENKSEIASCLAIDDPVTTQPLSGYTAFLKRKRGAEVEVSRSTEQEHIRYFNAPLEDTSVDVLNYWKRNSANYPILSKMAEDYLTVQVSSVASF